MKRIQHLIFLLSFVCFSAKAQSNISAIAEINYNTFSHTSLSNFQKQLLNDVSEVSLKVNDDFGANIGYSIGIKIENIDTQFFVSYNSTGGKISYSDFSGVIRVTQLLQAYTFGGEYQVKLLKEDSKEMFYFGGRAFINFSSLALKSYSKISDSVSSESIDFSSIDLGLGIRLIYEIPISVVKLRLSAGYDLMLGGELRFKKDNKLSLENDQGNRVKTGWSGFRSGVGIVIPF